MNNLIRPQEPCRIQPRLSIFVDPNAEDKSNDGLGAVIIVPEMHKVTDVIGYSAHRNLQQLLDMFPCVFCLCRVLSFFANLLPEQLLQFLGIHVNVGALGVVLFGVLKHLFKIVLEAFQSGVCSADDFLLDSIQRYGSSDLLIVIRVLILTGQLEEEFGDQTTTWVLVVLDHA